MSLTSKKPLLNFLNVLPVIGIVVFIILYFYASTLYPGGNQNDLNYEGYNWLHNYWCNLMNEEAMNGMANLSRPYAIIAMYILCLGMAIFFFNFSRELVNTRVWKVLISISGLLSMATASFMFTTHHDFLTILSSIFGFVALVGVIITLYKSNYRRFKIGAFLCVLLLVMNNFIYYSKFGIYFLPLLQKITFVAVLLWIACLSLKLRR